VTKKRVLALAAQSRLACGRVHRPAMARLLDSLKNEFVVHFPDELAKAWRYWYLWVECPSPEQYEDDCRIGLRMPVYTPDIVGITLKDVVEFNTRTHPQRINGVDKHEWQRFETEAEDFLYAFAAPEMVERQMRGCYTPEM